mmetsp:Transcript_44464/g.105367  ORF Transcript_44464/g.105367 Transcript_44464/m.105367 type:complete len:236 (+) Transcript_44464:779-1486(+)
MMYGINSCAWKLLPASMIIVSTTIVQTSAIVLRSTVLSKIRSSEKAEAALKVRKNFITFSIRMSLATLRLMEDTLKTLVKAKSTRVDTTMKTSKSPRGSRKMTIPRAQYLSTSSAANHIVNPASTSSMTLRCVFVTPVLLSSPTSSPATIPSNSKRMIMLTMFNSITSVQNMSNSRDAKRLRIGLKQRMPDESAAFVAFAPSVSSRDISVVFEHVPKLDGMGLMLPMLRDSAPLE